MIAPWGKINALRESEGMWGNTRHELMWVVGERGHSKWRDQAQQKQECLSLQLQF